MIRSVVGTRSKYFITVLWVNLVYSQGHEHFCEFKYILKNSDPVLGQVLCSCVHMTWCVHMNVLIYLQTARGMSQRKRYFETQYIPG